MRKEGFSVEGAGFAKAMVIEESDIFASEEKTSYKLHIPRIVINPDSKIALTGQNGTGKSLFIKHLISELEKSGRTKEVMYLPQEIPEDLKNQILSDFNELEDTERGAVLSTLYRLGSEPENLQQGSVSPGELRKLMISLAVEKPLSLLILDEPTNHMDITSVLALESALSSLSCALIVVSHDRAFLEKVTDVKLHTERIENEGRIFYDL